MRELLPLLKRLSLQILLLLLIYFISRSVFTLLNLDQFRGLDITTFLKLSFFALRFDISAILTINALYIFLLLLPVPAGWILWQRVTQIIFLVTNIFALIFEISDWSYFGFTLKRSTVDVLDMVSRKGDFWALLPHFILDFWYVPLSLILISLALIFINRRIVRSTPIPYPTGERRLRSSLIRVAGLIIVLGLSLIGIRGGLQLVPIGVQNAVQVTDNAFVPVVVNTPFSIMHSYTNQKVEELHFYTPEELRTYFDPVKQYGRSEFQAKNVVFIIVESLSKEFTGIGGRRSYTPFLDSLIQSSYVCVNAYANALHSAEGIPAILSGMPSLMSEPITTSFYGTNKLTSIPRLLKTKGYETAFYHGGTNGTMGFDIYASGAGFDKYYGREEYNNEDDYDGHWGIWDEPFLQYFADGLSTMKQPFMVSVFTLTSHDPFKVPAMYKGRFPKGELPIQECVGYTDLAIRKFFEKASRQPWYANTLFVITADHCSPKSKDRYYSSYNMGRYAIPIIFYAPGDARLRGTTANVMQQIDILPTVMDYLGYKEPFFAFGNSIFSNAYPRYVINEETGNYQWYMDGLLLTTKGLKAAGLYNFEKDSLCNYNIIQRQKPVLDRHIMPYFLAFMQVYRYAMVHNKLWVEHTAAMK
jgi:phosphoglycerol transferase MdoB-like AlkP superfamily enzyme